MRKITFILTIICVLTGCRNNTNKNIPKRLLRIEVNGEEINLIHIEKVNYFGEEAIYFVIARGDWDKWSKRFAKCNDCSIFGGEGNYSMRFIQDNNRFKLEKVDWDITPGGGEPPRPKWENVGYSTDNTLWAKIFEYYQKNKNIMK